MVVHRTSFFSFYRPRHLHVGDEMDSIYQLRHQLNLYISFCLLILLDSQAGWLSTTGLVGHHRLTHQSMRTHSSRRCPRPSGPKVTEKPETEGVQDRGALSHPSHDVMANAHVHKPSTFSSVSNLVHSYGHAPQND